MVDTDLKHMKNSYLWFLTLSLVSFEEHPRGTRGGEDVARPEEIEPPSSVGLVNRLFNKRRIEIFYQKIKCLHEKTRHSTRTLNLYYEL